MGVRVAEGRRVSGASDAALLAATRDGSDEAFLVLYDRYRDLAWRVARSASTNDLDAEDAVAEAFARVFAAAADREIDSFRSYLAATVRNCVTDSHRRRDRPSGDVEVVGPAAIVPSVEDRVLDLTDQDVVARAFATLPERYRSALWMTEVEAFTPHEVGHVLGTSPNAASALAMRARERLRQAFLVEHLAGPLATACADTTRHLAALVRGSASRRVTAKVEAHVARCPGCTGRLREVRGLNESLAALVPVAPATLLAGDRFLARVHGSVPDARGVGSGPLSHAGTSVGNGLHGLADATVPYVPAVQGIADRVLQPVAAAVAGLFVAGAVAVGGPGPHDPADAVPPHATHDHGADVGAGIPNPAGQGDGGDDPLVHSRASVGATGVNESAPGGGSEAGVADSGNAPPIGDPAGDVGLIVPAPASPTEVPDPSGSDPSVPLAMPGPEVPSGAGDEVGDASNPAEDEVADATDDFDPRVQPPEPATQPTTIQIPTDLLP